jgi:myosin heavy subunit
MADDYQNPGPDPEKNAENGARKRRNLLIGIVGVLVLLNGFLGYLYFNQKSKTKEKKEALIATEQLKKDLQEEVKNYKSSVADLKGQNARLDSIISKRESDIQKKAARIRDLLEQRKIRIQKYREAREEIEQLRYYTEKYQNQIDSLVRVNKELRAKNQNLASEVRETRKEKSKLAEDKARLENKVSLGSRLKLKEAKVTGVKVKNDGDKKETDNTNKIDQLKVCFNFQDNPISDPGKRRILIRVLNPNGETIFIKSRGSGKFTYKKDTALYTYSAQVNYQNKDKLHCTYWSKGSEFSKGKHTVKLYTNGYLVGKHEFELKSGFLNLF